MMHVFPVRMVIAAVFASSLCGSTTVFAACWSVFDSDNPGSDDTVMETICVGSNMQASFGEATSYFGDIKKCGKVSVSGAADQPQFNVDLSACDGLPSHTIACEPATGSQIHCTLTFSSDQGQRPVTLMPGS